MRYRVAHLLIGLLIFSLLFAGYRWWDRGTELQRAVSRAGGRIERSHYALDEYIPPDRFLQLYNSAAADDDLVAIALLLRAYEPVPFGVWLPADVSDRVLLAFLAVPELEQCFFVSDNVSRDALREVRKAKSLRHLLCASKNVDDQFLLGLAEIKTLTHLFPGDESESSYTAEGIEALRVARPDLHIETD